MHHPHQIPTVSRLWYPSNYQANANLLLLESAILQTMTFPAGPIYLDQTGFGFAVAAPGTTGPGKLWQVSGTPTNVNLASAVDGDWAVDLLAQPRALWGPKLTGAWPSTPVTASSLSVAAVWYGWGTPSNTLGQLNDVYLDQMTGQWYGPYSGSWPVSGFNPQAGAVLATVGAPSNSVGQNGMWAMDTVAGLVYGPKTTGVWPPGVPMAPVAVGVWRATTGVPDDSFGNDGDFALDKAELLLYGPKDDGAWPVETISLKPRPGIVLATTGAPSSGVGIQGDWAFDGAARIIYGPRGASTWPTGIALGAPVTGIWRLTTGAPSNTVGNDGDAALDPAARKYYVGTWSAAADLVPVVTGVVHGTSGVPANTVGNDGDWAFDAQANTTYGMKSGGVWPTPGIKGYAVPQTSRATITGSRTTDTVNILGQLLTALAATGQVIDSTTP